MKKNILFPIETISRELDAKLILAGMYASKERNIYIGQHDYLYSLSKYMEGGLYLGKNMFLRKKNGGWINRHSKLKSKGFTMVHLDEEGGVYWGEEDEWERMLNRRLDVSKIDNTDFICTWGGFQKNYYQDSIGVNNDQVIVTGHPRFDLLKSKYKDIYKNNAEKIKLKYGKFILVPTPFQLSNNPFGNADTFSKRVGYDVTDDESRKRYIGYWSYSGKTFSDYVKMITHTSIKFPHINIILRPHPSEGIDIYNKIFSGVKNVHVVREESIMPWILACELLISDGCTTSIEAYISETPVIIYQPNEEPEHHMFLPSLAGIKSKTIDDVVNNIKLILSNKPQEIANPRENHRALKLLNNFSAEDAFENILSVLNKAEKLKPDQLNKFNKTSFNMYRMRHEFLTALKRPVRLLFQKKYRDYIAYKNGFPGFNEEEILVKMQDIEKITNKKINCKVINSNLILITQK
jgi:surface carbohydrate biosynthesis protein